MRLVCLPYSGKFKQHVFRPLILEVTTPTKYADAVETVISRRDQTAFIMQNNEDREVCVAGGRGNGACAARPCRCQGSPRPFLPPPPDADAGGCPEAEAQD